MEATTVTRSSDAVQVSPEAAPRRPRKPRWRPTRKQVAWTAAAAILLLLIIYGLLPDPVPVQAAAVAGGPLRVVIEEEGETQVLEHYIVTAPVAGYMRRIELEVGDPVGAGQVLVQLESPRAVDLDPRTRRELEARVAAARAMAEQAADQARGAAATARLAVEERDRLARLVEAGAATPQALERAEAEAAQAQAALEAARSRVVAAQAELATAQAVLQPAADTAPVQQVVRAPNAGRVLAIHRRSAGHVNPGEPLIEIGDTSRLEVVAEVLSQDAVRIPHGARVQVDQWGGDVVLEGVVERVEPRAFTRISALGVAEQRVQVVSALTTPAGEWAPLGSGYRVLARFVIWEGEDVLQVPTGALFRVNGRWAVFVMEGGRARQREVTLGRQAGLAAQVVAGLDEGDIVIMHPDDRIAEGVRVRRR
jgi:HlyD family secretion protein